MKQAISGILTCVILGLLMATQPGCLVVAAAGATGAGVAYVRGDLEMTFDADPKTLADATENAFKQLDVAVISKSSSALDGKIIGRTARDVKLEVCITGEGGNLSKASIRAGTFGDSTMQERVAAAIREQLHATASAGPTTQPATRPVIVDAK